MSNERVDFYNPAAEAANNPCYSFRILAKTSEVDLLKNRKVLRRFKQKDFKGVDFNNIEDISKLLNIIKKEGFESLKNSFNIKD